MKDNKELITAKEISELKHSASVILTCDQVDAMAELCLKQSAEIERLRELLKWADGYLNDNPKKSAKKLQKDIEQALKKESL